jgi:hypothetical protein
LDKVVYLMVCPALIRLFILVEAESQLLQSRDTPFRGRT